MQTSADIIDMREAARKLGVSLELLRTEPLVRQPSAEALLRVIDQASLAVSLLYDDVERGVPIAQIKHRLIALEFALADVAARRTA